jgi:hypothetical protein
MTKVCLEGAAQKKNYYMITLCSKSSLRLFSVFPEFFLFSSLLIIACKNPYSFFKAGLAANKLRS